MCLLKKTFSTILLLILTVAHITPVFAADKVIHYDGSNGLSSPLVGGGVQDRHGLLWFATWNGLNCYDGYEFHRVSIGPDDRVSSATNRIRDILLSADGNIICHTDYGVYEFDLGSYSFRDIPSEKADSLLPFLGRRWHGLTDHQGNRWTADKTGVFKTYVQTSPAYIFPGTEDENPRAFLADRDSMLWIGTRGVNGVNVYDRNGRQVRRIDLDSAPYCIFQSVYGPVWIGCKPGALYKDDGTLITNDIVYDICEDSRGRLWIATFGDGVKYCADPSSNNPVFSPSLGGGKVRKLYITPDDMLVAATDDGVLVGDVGIENPGEIKLRHLRRDGNNPSGLSSNAVMSVGGDGKGNIFFCTESSGIDMVSEPALHEDNPVFTHFSKSNSSLTDDIFTGMTVVSDSVIFLVCADHIMVFNPIADTTVNFSKVFWGDSCNFNETTPVRIPDGCWVFGAREGAYVAGVKDLANMEEIPPLIFTTLSINGGADRFCLPPLDAITLMADERNVTVGYAALDYIDNADILYRTRLDGLSWTGATRSRSVNLFGLAPGLHLLEVQSTDRYGRWVDNTRTIEITVLPFWYETWWARIIFVLLALFIVSGLLYIYLYIRRINRRSRELLEKYMEIINRDIGDSHKEVAQASSELVPLVPDQKPEDAAFLNRVRRYVEDNITNPEANINDMAVASATSRSTLNRRLRSQLGITAAQLLIEARMQRAVQLLESHDKTECPISDIAVQCGYSDSSYFQRVFKKKFGVTPAVYRASYLSSRD